MKLSEAIRKGAELRPQAFGQYFEEGTSCALGAAAEALDEEIHQALVSDTYPEIGRTGDVLHAQFPTLFTRTISTSEMQTIVHVEDWPEYSLLYKRSLWTIIPYLNDTLRWSREKIADWLEGKGL